MERVTEPLARMGAGVETTTATCRWASRHGRCARSRYELPVASAQVKSAILLAGLYATRRDDGRRAGADPRPHRAACSRRPGVAITRREKSVTVQPAERLELGEIEVPGDFSSAAPFIVAATLVPGSELHIHGVNLNPRRTGLLDDPRADGRARDASTTAAASAASRPATSRCARPSSSRRRSLGAEVPLAIDELPLFALAASCAHGNSRLRGAEELRAKESDRVEATVDALRALGQHVLATEDGFRIRGVPTRPRGGRIESRGDHRIAMLGAVAGARLAGGRRDRGRRVRRQ